MIARDPMSELLDRVDWVPFYGPHRLGVHVTHVGWVRLSAEMEGAKCFSDVELQVYKLSDGQRVFDAADV